MSPIISRLAGQRLKPGEASDRGLKRECDRVQASRGSGQASGLTGRVQASWSQAAMRTSATGREQYQKRLAGSTHNAVDASLCSPFTISTTCIIPISE